MKKDKDKRAKKRKAQATPRLAATRSVRTGRIISATRAARSFSELLDRVCYRGESFVIERGGELVCEMARVRPPRLTGSDFLSVVRSLPKPDPQYWKAVEEATKQRSTIPESPWES
jgi:antitoxin (DNA-binding transcriptional repressor) of toxin-antitoxin stability system